jgi:hypothetical protein
MRFLGLTPKRLAVSIGALLLATSVPIYNGFSGKVGEYLFKYSEGHLPVTSVPASPSPATSSVGAIASGPGPKQIDSPPDIASVHQSALQKPFLTMNSNTGISNMTILLGKNGKVGILNDGVDGAKFNDLAVKNAQTAGIVNRNSSNLEFNRVDVEMAPESAPEHAD